MNHGAPRTSFCNTPEASPHRPAKRVGAFLFPGAAGGWQRAEGFATRTRDTHTAVTVDGSAASLPHRSGQRINSNLILISSTLSKGCIC